ncbi:MULTISPECIES: dTDP-4-dehydrorhamnose 3,5-epimerase [Rhodomicrobium]|uniref:dTDP-4-dehydrorhamnose 3,5-epimerase n=1 Tax=Rhodomicrobium TaxID=1068 RepID=UPI000B4A651F|nr:MULTISPECIES: dTDP-4-dehydrorhamnose 3,5-epimerase [Rhodomicrobium]
MSTSSKPSSSGARDLSEGRTWRFTSLALPEVILIQPPRFEDTRGWFCETYSQRIFEENGIDLTFVQDNSSFSEKTGTVRGLHYQTEPFAQDKLVRVLRGRILDVAVDIRKSSPTFGRHISAELSASNGRALLVPAGFAHGFVTLEPGTLVAYKVTAYYAAGHEHGIFWADPALGIDWGLGSAAEATLSHKDMGLPALAQAEHLFV